MFHDYIMTWWQAGALKLAMVIIGILIGATWPAAFKKPAVCWTLFIVAIVLVVYLAILFWPQMF